MNPLTLVILDGWGQTPNMEGNAILSVPTPNFDQLLSYFPHAALHASGEEVGLSWGEMGNSEVGHLNLGCGRIIMQDLPRIDKTIKEGTFFANKELLEAYDRAQKNNRSLHLVGLVSAGGVHSHLNHLLALLDLAGQKKFSQVFVHMITDGRDTPPQVALNDLKTLEAKFQSLGLGKVASVMGRYFAMDRDKHWDRVQKAFDAMTSASWPKKASTAAAAIEEAYSAKQTDEFIEPIVIEGVPRIQDGDSIVFFNFRSDRARQLSECFISHDFKDFPRKVSLDQSYFVSFTSYGHEPTPNVKVAFFAEKIEHQLAQVVSENNLKQFHLAETEKYAHVTYFFNGGQEQPFTGEERLLIPSPKVPTYDLKPEMSAREVAQGFLDFFAKTKPEFSVINFANADMVGHTGNLEATKKAIVVVDECLGKVSSAVLQAGGNLIVTADHGNAEQKINLETGEINKEHTTNPVPLILAFGERRQATPIPIDLNYKINFAATAPVGVLADVTATSLDILGLNAPPEISGQSLRKVI